MEVQFVSENHRTVVAIFGGPGGGAVVAHSVRNLTLSGQSLEFRGFLNDYLPVGTMIDGFPVLGEFSAWRNLPEETRFIAPLHKVKCMPERARRVSDLDVPERRWCNVVDPSAQIMAHVRLGTGIAIAPYAVVQSDVCIGNHVAIRSGAMIGHNCHLSEFVFVGGNAILCGYVRVERGAHISPGASIREGAHIGAFAVIGMGAVVLDDVPDYAVVAGNPAHMIDCLNADRSVGSISHASSAVGPVGET